MQPTNEQVERSLAALRAELDEQLAGAPVRHPERWLLAIELERVLARMPAVRADRVDAARRRLAAGDTPSASELAERVVGRLVCDRLR